MADYTNRVVNPWVLHLQKIGLELKCPLCLELLNRPLMLPCDHIFCDSCVPRSQDDPDCPVCRSKYEIRDLRDMRFMGNIISIYKSLNTAVSAHLSQLPSANEYMGKNGAPNFCRTQKGSRSEEFKAVNTAVIKCSDSHSHDDSLDPSSQESNPRRPKYKNVAAEMHQAEQLFESPSSLDDAKGSDNDTSDHTPGTYAGQTAKRMLDTHASGAMEIYSKDSKRQKKLMYTAADHDCKDRPDQFTENLTASDMTICGFCQSSRTSEATGEMLHYCKGRQVTGDDIFRSNVIHVHSACIEWAPQAYYEEDSVKNLKAELDRGMKIKCTQCGLKGAALGCFVTSCRRSYHVPCARQIPKCRWDNDDFLLLCPAHSSVKFPNEKSKSKARISSAQPPLETTPVELGLAVNRPMETKKLVLCGSALSHEEKHLLEKLASKLGATISRFWNTSVTHVIASTDENGACTRTLKVLMGILHGKWILNADWMKASLEAFHPVDEESYEIAIDTQGCRDGPRTARLRAAADMYERYSFSYRHQNFSTA
ncbi:PREDICTED: BRCA1-associated RING domain protein 1 isoform X2 [Tarenaya hassleriana]|uniref:BRCA1-associated RING domain protein 1 isoform X2 n=1 Tax=Tarenaya hassleriana TaxID=28532 RepID=UPI00053C7F15|nr:PREDICTED: BRCA1-associated RING domain protein 1 isoform X2 [Tarenaya hassleriana]